MPACLCRTWSELFPPAFPNDTCGFSFKSAFYDPGVSDTYPDDLMTPALTARPAMLSRVSVYVVVGFQWWWFVVVVVGFSGLK